MAAPVQQRIWTITPNQRIPIATYTTLVLLGGRYLRLIATTLLANGYTCKGSCDGVTGAMDGVNRWTTDANASVQAANTTTPVSWIVLTDGNGCNILMSFVGATGDIARLAFSPSGVYVAAGTPSHTPTATDEQVLNSSVASLITTSTVNDRVLHVWTDSEAKMMRVACYAGGTLANGNWGVELVNANRVTITYSPAVWGFFFTAANMLSTGSGMFQAFAANSVGGYARINGTTTNIFAGAEGSGGTFAQFNSATRLNLQKGVGQAMFPIVIGSTTATRQGPIGYIYDWWTCGQGVATGVGGVVFPGGEWIQLADNASGTAWPWDGSTPPQTT